MMKGRFDGIATVSTKNPAVAVLSRRARHPVCKSTIRYAFGRCGAQYAIDTGSTGRYHRSLAISARKPFAFADLKDPIEGVRCDRAVKAIPARYPKKQTHSTNPRRVTAGQSHRRLHSF